MAVIPLLPTQRLPLGPLRGASWEVERPHDHVSRYRWLPLWYCIPTATLQLPRPPPAPVYCRLRQLLPQLPALPAHVLGTDAQHLPGFPTPTVQIDLQDLRRVQPVPNRHVIGTFPRSLRLLDIDWVALLRSRVSGRLPESLLPGQLCRAEFSILAKGGFLADDRAAAPAFFDDQLVPNVPLKRSMKRLPFTLAISCTPL